MEMMCRNIFRWMVPVLVMFFLVSCGEKEILSDVLLSQCLTEAEKGNWEGAEKLSSAVLARDKNNIHALILQALAMHNTDRLQEAMDSISSAVKLAPGNFYAQYLNGYFAYKSGRYKEAVRPLNMAQNLKPDDLNTLVLLAQTHYKLKNDRLAISFYKKLALHPKYKNSATPVNALGILYYRSNPKLAEMYFLNAAKRAKVQEHPLTSYNSAVFYELTRNKKSAVVNYRKFVAETKDKAGFGPLREKVLLHLKNF
ncbi:MAG: hypothetical protein J6S53_11840 [Lentisphaeria bacterium]|nr:hypothetical protein [Lentisphaeria bacterium]